MPNLNMSIVSPADAVIVVSAAVEADSAAWDRYVAGHPSGSQYHRWRWRQVFEMDETVQAQIARLTSDVQHVQTDVADLKVGLRRVGEKLDAVNGRIDGVNDNIYRVEGKLTDKMEAIRSGLTEKIDGLRSEFNEKIDRLRSEIDGLRSEISSLKVWALTLYFAQAGSLLFVMAKGFKWL